MLFEVHNPLREDEEVAKEEQEEDFLDLDNLE